MKNVDKHGLRMQGLRAACGATADYGWYSGRSIEITYNLTSGKVGWKEFFDDAWQTIFDDPNVLYICRTKRHMTQQEIADAIMVAVERDKLDKAFFARLEEDDAE